jgi:hypothetical protein
MWPVTFIVGLGPRQLLKHLPACRRCPALVQLVLASSKLTTRAQAPNFWLRQYFFFSIYEKGEAVGAPWPPDFGRSTPG